jgi:hypothetical protein
MSNSEDRMTFLVNSRDPQARKLTGANIDVAFVAPIRPRRIDNWQSYEVALYDIQFDYNPSTILNTIDVECNLMLLSNVGSGERKVIARMPQTRYIAGQVGGTETYVEPDNLLWMPLDSFTEIRQIEVRLTDSAGATAPMVPASATTATFVIRRKAGE